MRPKALDLFCGAGGVSVGLQRAGFDVTGVDINPQPNHKGGTFVQADALEYPLEGFDFIWASPPCQAFTAYRRGRPGHVKPSPDLIAPTRARLHASGSEFAIENVPGSTLYPSLLLCGSMFGLDVRRHRWFETSMLIMGRDCAHHLQAPARFPSPTNRETLRKTVEVGAWRIPLAVQQKAMGIDWMPRKELSQAIPPAYATYIGRQVIAHIK